MKCLKFTLEGKTAFFKIPEVNSICYFTYGNLHKPALLGILGAICGYGGYFQQKQTGADLPEYYHKLENLKVSIVPGAKDGYFEKKIQYFNNSVGYASQEMGGNLVVKEQWIENPSWTIYVQLDCAEAEHIAEMVVNRRCIYMPYLGKNDHPATIVQAEILELEEISREEIEKCGEFMLRCLTPKKDAKFEEDELTYRYQEFLPIGLNPVTNHYETEQFILTDAVIIECHTPVFADQEVNIVFY